MRPGNRDIELHYTAIEISAPEKIGFRYKLDPVDSWLDRGAGRRTVYYPHLPPGDFTFHVQACNADGQWSDTGHHVGGGRPAFLLGDQPGFAPWPSSGLLRFVCRRYYGWLLRRRYRLRLARLQTLNAIERERLRISKDMHDHVGSVLTQVSQLTDMGLNETDDKTLVKKRLERIGNRARVAVQALDEIVWATNPKNDNLASFAEYVSRFSDEFFEYTNIRCWQEVPTTLPAMPLRAEVRHNVFLAVREALNNALKHSECAEVWLQIRWMKVRSPWKFEDNGCGFTSSAGARWRQRVGNMRDPAG